MSDVPLYPPRLDRGAVPGAAVTRWPGFRRMSDMSPIIYYGVVGEFGACKHRHRTPEAAVRCEESIGRAVRRNSPGAYTTARAAAVHADGGSTPVEWHRNEHNEPVLGPDPAFLELED